MTIYDEVLKTLLSVNSKENSTIDPHHILGEKCPHLTVQQIEATLGEMEQNGHIKRIVGNRRTVKAILLPSAYLYFNKQAEIEAAKMVEKLDDRRWTIKVALMGYGAGLVSGVVLMWVKAAFFP